MQPGGLRFIAWEVGILSNASQLNVTDEDKALRASSPLRQERQLTRDGNVTERNGLRLPEAPGGTPAPLSELPAYSPAAGHHSSQAAGLESVTLAGPFQPEAISRLLPPEKAAQMAGLRGFNGVPVNLLAAALCSRGIKTTVIGGIRGAESRAIHSDPLSVVVYKGSGGWPFVLNGRLRERREILARLRELDPPIVHAHWTFEAGRAVADWKGPKLLTVQDAAWEYARLGMTPTPISVAYGTRLLANTSATLSRFRHIIAISPYTEAYLRLVPRFRGEIRVIPNIVPELPPDLSPSDRFPRSGRVTFACYGNPGPLKNIPAAIRAFRLLAKRVPDARLLVFGSGWERLQAETPAREGIEFRGGIPHAQFLRALVDEVDIWVHPARIETQGLVLCEALQAGCAVVAGRNSGAVSWTLDYGRAGLLVDVEDANELAEGMRTLIDRREHALQMVSRGRQFIRDNFAAERIVDLHLDFYRDILA
jgi:glycosyltransferase involved in cell wall biosynthesis